MKLKLFHAPRMAEAMALLRAEFGSDAVILSTRRVAGGVEITGGIDRPPAGFPIVSSRIRDALAFHMAPPPLVGALLQGDFLTQVTTSLPFAALPLAQGAKPLLLVGPPGVGKTLTVARLATRLVMARATPVIVTADGRRAGATEQIAAYTRILGLELTIASDPQTLARQVATHGAEHAMIVDTTGINPFCAEQRALLGALAVAADARLALVLPAGMDAAEADETMGIFAALGARHLIITKMDIARRLGCVWGAARHGLALAEAGIGPGAADGLVPMTPAFLAERLLSTWYDTRLSA